MQAAQFGSSKSQSRLKLHGACRSLRKAAEIAGAGGGNQSAQASVIQSVESVGAQSQSESFGQSKILGEAYIQVY